MTEEMTEWLRGAQEREASMAKENMALKQELGRLHGYIRAQEGHLATARQRDTQLGQENLALKDELGRLHAQVSTGVASFALGAAPVSPNANVSDESSDERKGGRALGFLRRYIDSYIGRRMAQHRSAILGPDTLWSANGAGWSGEGDPFLYHRYSAVSALSRGVAAVYGYDVDGDIAEFGTMTGETAAGLARAIANCDRYLRHALSAFGKKPRQLHLYDSFEGLPQIDNDIDSESPHVKTGAWSPGACRGISVAALGEKLQSHLPAERVLIVPGFYRDTVPLIPTGTRYSLVHIDSDLYSSARDVLDGLFGRGLIAPGAILYFDDWNCNHAAPSLGERRAWRECVEKFGIEATEELTYAIFARCFIVHNYRSAI